MKRRTALLGLVLAVGFWYGTARADLQQMIGETQKLEQLDGGFRIVWWIPTDYWRESFKKSAITPAQADAFYKSVDDYIVFAVADIKVSPLGVLTPVARDQVVSELSVRVGAGHAVKPFDAEELRADTKTYWT